MHFIDYIVKHSVELENFEAWSGGRDTLNEIKAHERSEEILHYLTDMLILIGVNKELTETDINDFLWFDAYDIVLEEFDIEL